MSLLKFHIFFLLNKSLFWRKCICISSCLLFPFPTTLLGYGSYQGQVLAVIFLGIIAAVKGWPLWGGQGFDGRRGALCLFFFEAGTGLGCWDYPRWGWGSYWSVLLCGVNRGVKFSSTDVITIHYQLSCVGIGELNPHSFLSSEWVLV